MRLPNPFRWLRTRNAAIASRRAASAARTKGVALGIEDPTADLEALADADRALLELGGPETIRPGERIALASGRIVTGWELACLAPDLVTLEILDDHDRFVAEELARDPELRRIYTALGKRDDLMAVADGVFETLCCHRWDVDPDVDSGVHTVQHLCVVAIPSHGYHECACGVWRMEIGATS